MKDEQRQEIMRLQAAGMRALSDAEMAQRQLQAAKGMGQRGPLTTGEQEAMRNFWPYVVAGDDAPGVVPPPKPPSIWRRIIAHCKRR